MGEKLMVQCSDCVFKKRCRTIPLNFMTYVMTTMKGTDRDKKLWDRMLRMEIWVVHCEVKEKLYIVQLEGKC